MADEWWREPFGGLAEFFQTQNLIMEAAIFGLRQWEAHPRFLEDYRSYEEEFRADEPEYAKRVTDERLESASERGAFALAQIESDFTAVHLHGCVLLWSMLETIVRDVAKACLLNDPACLIELPKVRVGVQEALHQDPSRRVEAVLSQVEAYARRETRGPLANIEYLLKTVGLDGAVRPELHSCLRRLVSARHLAAHHRGRVNERFCQDHPDWRQKPGELLVLGSDEYSDFRDAVVEYALAIHARVAARYGGRPVAGYGVRGREVPAGEPPPQ